MCYNYRMTNGSERQARRETRKTDLTRVTINLTPRSVQALESLQEARKEDATTTINDALTLAKLLARYVDAEGVLTVKNAKGEIHVIPTGLSPIPKPRDTQT